MHWPWSRKRRETFDSPPRPIDQLFLEMQGRDTGTVTRVRALSVPAVQRGRNMICSVATLPLELHDPDHEVQRSPLLRQLDVDVPNVVTLAQTLEDLLFDGISWWLVTATDFAGYPISVRHLDGRTVSVNPPTGRSQAPLPSGVDPRSAVVWVDGKSVPASRVIRFDSPNPPVLQVGARAIRRAILLDKAAGMYADDPRPLDYFTPNESADPASDDEIKAMLAKWKAARKQRSTAYVPAALMYHSVDAPSPAELQLMELQRQASLDIANALGIDPEDLGISTTSRTYSNDVDRRRNKLNEVLAPFMRAITDRLSMGDVTRRGYTVRFNTAEYLQPNPTDRWGVYSTAKGLGLMTDDEIRDAEGLPPLPPPPPPPPPPPAADRDPAGDEDDADEGEQVEADAAVQHTFDGPATFTMDVPVAEFSVDRDNRIIEGLAVPYGAVGRKGGMQFRFAPDSMTWNPEQPSRVKLVYPGHGNAIGRAIQLRNTRGGLLARFKVARGAAGDEALSLAEDQVFDGLSVGVEFDDATDTLPDPKDRNVLLVRRADLRHVALTAEPVFDDARVTRVAASRTTGGHVANTETTEPGTAPNPADGDAGDGQAPAGLALSQDQLTALLTRPGAIEAIVSAQQPATPDEPATPAGALTLSAEQVDGLIRAGQLGALLGLPGVGAPAGDEERPTPVDPTRSIGMSRVTEPAPYRFDREGNLRDGTHDFSSDLIAAGRDHDKAAHDRALAFVRAQFDVQTGDVNELNPTINRPDMYVDQLDYEYPLWQAINRGSLASVTPFTVPKFSSAADLVGDHTEGVEPTTGTFVVTSQTITPTALSGKAEITREAWDQGGNPQLSGLVWAQMVREWNEELEAATATFLNTLTAAADITITTAAADEALAAEWDDAMASLQFVRGGHRFSMFGVHIDLYKAFVAARDSSGRPLYAILNPQNANGTATPRFGALDLGGVMGVPSWALGATGTAAANSWLFNPADVHGWASPPQRLNFEYQVKSVEVGIWGYKAFANTRIDGVRQVIFDPAV